MLSLSRQTNDTVNFLNEIEISLNNSYDFTGMYMGMTGFDFLARARMINNTAQADFLTAVNALNGLRALYTTAKNLNISANDLDTTVTDALMAIRNAINDSIQVQADIDTFMSQYSINRMKLSEADMDLVALGQVVQSHIDELLIENVTTSDTFRMVMNLTDTYLQRLDYVLMLRMEVESLQVKLQQTVASARNILYFADVLYVSSR